MNGVALNKIKARECFKINNINYKEIDYTNIINKENAVSVAKYNIDTFLLLLHLGEVVDGRKIINDIEYLKSTGNYSSFDNLIEDLKVNIDDINNLEIIFKKKCSQFEFLRNNDFVEYYWHTHLKKDISSNKFLESLNNNTKIGDGYFSKEMFKCLKGTEYIIIITIRLFNKPLGVDDFSITLEKSIKDRRTIENILQNLVGMGIVDIDKSKNLYQLNRLIAHECNFQLNPFVKALSGEINSADYRVYLAISYLKNIKSQTELGKLLNTSQGNISKSIERLLAMNLLVIE